MILMWSANVSPRKGQLISCSFKVLIFHNLCFLLGKASLVQSSMSTSLQVLCFLIPLERVSDLGLHFLLSYNDVTMHGGRVNCFNNILHSPLIIFHCICKNDDFFVSHTLSILCLTSFQTYITFTYSTT